MRIDWKITKKRGNLRPLLTYTVTLEEHEKALALPPLRVRSSIPEPEDSWQEHCYPGQMERAEGGRHVSCYELESPSHRGKSWPQTLRLPWREDNAYPEVEASFLAFRKAFESLLEQACASAPMQEEGASVRAKPPARWWLPRCWPSAFWLRLAGGRKCFPSK